jgi:hypothetical protein
MIVSAIVISQFLAALATSKKTSASRKKREKAAALPSTIRSYSDRLLKLDHHPNMDELELTLANIQGSIPRQSDLTKIATQYVGGNLRNKADPIKEIRKMFIQRAREEGDIENVQR